MIFSDETQLSELKIQQNFQRLFILFFTFHFVLMIYFETQKLHFSLYTTNWKLPCAYSNNYLVVVSSHETSLRWNARLCIGEQNLPGKKNGTALQKCLWVVSLARNAVVVIIGIILSYSLSSYGIKPFKITGNITEGLPSFGPPPFSVVSGNHTYNFVEVVSELGSTTISVPLIAILESIAIAKAFGTFLKSAKNIQVTYKRAWSI